MTRPLIPAHWQGANFSGPTLKRLQDLEVAPGAVSHWDNQTKKPRRLFPNRLKYVSSNLGFGRQSRTATLARRILHFKQLILNQSLSLAFRLIGTFSDRAKLHVAHSKDEN
jgi:hypothetical protein